MIKKVQNIYHSFIHSFIHSLLLEGYPEFKEIFYSPLWESLPKEIHFAFVLRLVNYVTLSFRSFVLCESNYHHP